MRKSFQLARRAGVAALALGLGGALVSATAASAAVSANPGGNPTFSTTGNNLPSTTLENLNLPTGAACAFPGSPTGEGYFSFLVPNGTDLTSLKYTGAQGPTAPDQGAPLVDHTGHALAKGNAATAPPGGINPQYAFGLQFSQLITALGYDANAGNQLPGGNSLIPNGQSSATYQAGVVCITGGSNPTPNTEDTYFSTPITFNVAPTSGPGSDPNGFTITIPQATGPVLPEAPLAVGLPLGGAAVLLGAAYLNRRRRTTPVAAG